jgi:TetR/AcrR family transcriptional regulator, transcriptional repressor for nem operon
MPRPRSYSQSKLIDDALLQFWRCGFNATSIDDLVIATGTSRRALYGSYGGKRELFLACFPRYQSTIVDAAFARVERADATLSEVAAYLETQIAAAEIAGLPGPGCFVANAATETAPHDPEIRKLVQQHNGRLKRGFAAIVEKAARRPSSNEVDRLATTFVVFANGLWSMSRVTADAHELRAAAKQFLDYVEGSLAHDTN